MTEERQGALGWQRIGVLAMWQELRTADELDHVQETFGRRSRDLEEALAFRITSEGVGTF